MGETFVMHSRTRIVRVALLSSLALAGCKEARCVVQTTQYTTSVSSTGYYGATAGLPVARFDLTQDFVTHEPYEACAQGPLQDVGVVRLKVTSLASTPLTLKYDIQGLNADSIPVWFHPDSIARLMPNQTLDIGEVSVTPTRVDHGARVILTAVAVVP